MKVIATLGLISCLHGQTLVDLSRQGRSIDFAGAMSTRPFATGPALPATCRPGEIYFLSTAPAGRNVYGCAAANVWSLQSGPLDSIFGRSGAVSAQTGDYSFSQIGGIAGVAQGGTGAATAAAARTNLGAAAATHSHPLTDLAGISGKQGNATVLATFGGGGFNSNDCARFDSHGNLVSAGAPCGTGGGGGGGSSPNYSQLFSGETSVTLEHGLNTENILVRCYSSTNTEVEAQAVTVVDSNNAAVTFATAQSGRCVVNGGSGGGGGGGVPSGPAGGDLTGSYPNPELAVTGILPGTYGSATQIPVLTLDAKGRVIQVESASMAAASAPVSGGVGVVVSGTGVKTVALDTAVVPTFLSDTASLTFTSIAAANCQERTFALSGAATTDSVAPGWPNQLNAGLTGLMFVSAPSTLTVRLCNVTSGALTPTSGLTYRGTILRSF